MAENSPETRNIPNQIAPKGMIFMNNWKKQRSSQSVKEE